MPTKAAASCDSYCSSAPDTVPTTSMLDTFLQLLPPLQQLCPLGQLWWFLSSHGAQLNAPTIGAPSLHEFIIVNTLSFPKFFEIGEWGRDEIWPAFLSSLSVGVSSKLALWTPHFSSPVNKHCPRGKEIDVFPSSLFLQLLQQQWIPVQQLCQLGQLWWSFSSYCPWKLLHISTATTTPKALEGRKAWIMPHDCWSRVWSWSPLINLLRKIELLATLFNSSFCTSLLITGLCKEEEEKVRRDGVGRGVRFIRKKGPLL